MLVDPVVLIPYLLKSKEAEPSRSWRPGEQDSHSQAEELDANQRPVGAVGVGDAVIRHWACCGR